MQKMMGRLRLYAQTAPITLESWLISFAGIVLIRTFFEQYSSYLPGRFPLIDLPTIVHYGAAYLAVFIVLMVILMYFAKTTLQEVSVICIFGFFVVLIAPIIDLATGGVGGHVMSYILVPGKELLIRFATFFGGHMTSGVTLGIQIETALGIIFCYSYVYNATKNMNRSIAAAFVFYCALFLLAATPSFMVMLLPPQVGSLNPIVQSMLSSHIIGNNMHPSFSGNSMGLLDLAFNKIMLGISLVVAIFASIVLFLLGAKKKLLALIKNSRPERIFYFFLLFTFGFVFSKGVFFSSWIDVESYILAILALVAAGMFSICQNDIYDEKIDVISNPDRPLATGILSKNEMENASKIFLVLAILSAYASGMYVLFFTCLMLFVYFIYSNPPLRLKRYGMLNSFLVSLACAGAVLDGFFLANPDKSILAFPFSLVLGIIIFHTAVANIRDIKDYTGDRAEGIKTLPVLLGLEKSKKIIAGAICIFYLLIPWYFHITFLVIPSIIAAVLSWYFITKKNYREWEGFAVYMCYLFLIIGAIFFR